MRVLLFRLAWLAMGALVALIALECMFRLLPVAHGLYRTRDVARWPLQGYVPGLQYIYSSRWQMLNVHRGKTNNYGHIAPFDYRPDSGPVIVVGDSYVEALMNDYPDTLQGQLGQRLGSPESVYGLGFSGLSASDYLVVSRLAQKEFSPVAAVFVIFNGDFQESLLARLGYYHFVPQGDSFDERYLGAERQEPENPVKNAIRGLYLYHYVSGNLGFSLDSVLPTKRSVGQSAEEGDAARAARDAAQHRVVDYFLSELPHAVGVSPRCIALLVDSDRYAIYDPKLASVPKEAPQVRRYFLEQAQRRGYAVSDLDRVFRARYAADRAKFDYWPNDRHWNRLGHGVGAEEAYRLLAGTGGEGCLPHGSGHR